MTRVIHTLALFLALPFMAAYVAVVSAAGFAKALIATLYFIWRD